MTWPFLSVALLCPSCCELLIFSQINLLSWPLFICAVDKQRNNVSVTGAEHLHCNAVVSCKHKIQMPARSRLKADSPRHSVFNHSTLWAWKAIQQLKSGRRQDTNVQAFRIPMGKSTRQPKKQTTMTNVVLPSQCRQLSTNTREHYFCRGLNPKSFEKTWQKSSWENRAFSGVIGAFKGLSGPFWADRDQFLSTSQPQQNLPLKETLAWLAPFRQAVVC